METFLRCLEQPRRRRACRFNEISSFSTIKTEIPRKLTSRCPPSRRSGWRPHPYGAMCVPPHVQTCDVWRRARRQSRRRERSSLAGWTSNLPVGAVGTVPEGKFGLHRACCATSSWTSPLDSRTAVVSSFAVRVWWSSAREQAWWVSRAPPSVQGRSY